jgi:hypothetical protein
MTVAADARRRLFDIVAQLAPMTVEGRERHVIYPGRDQRVLRVVRKIVRGLCHHHGVGTAIPDAKVWADILDPPPPPELLKGVELHHAERDIVEYWYDDDGEHPVVHSTWFLRFFERRNFLALVNKV